MIVSDVIHGRVTTADLRRADGKRFPEGLVSKSEVLFIEGQDGEIRLQVGDGIWEVESAQPRDCDILRQISTRSLPLLAWLVQPVPAQGPADSALIQFHEFPASLVWDESMEIGVDDKVVDDMRKRQRRQVSVESAVQWLTERMLLPSRKSDGPPRALLSGCPGRETNKKTAFRLYGAGFAVDVERGSDDRLRITRVVTSRLAVEGDENRPIYMVTGPISFCDDTSAGQFRGVARTELDTLVEQSDSYLGLWKMYNDKERESILRRARQFGWVGYSSRRRLHDGTWRFSIDLNEKNIADLWRRLVSCP